MKGDLRSAFWTGSFLLASVLAFPGAGCSSSPQSYSGPSAPAPRTISPEERTAQIGRAYERWLEGNSQPSERAHDSVDYDRAVAAVRGIDYSLEDTERFANAYLRGLAEHEEFAKEFPERDAGLYLSALINKVVKEGDTVNLKFGEAGKRIHNVGYRLARGTLIADHVGEYAVYSMKGGTFIAKTTGNFAGMWQSGGTVDIGTTGDLPCIKQSGGTFRAEIFGDKVGMDKTGGITEGGSMGEKTGWGMSGGIIRAKRMGNDTGFRIKGGRLEADEIESISDKIPEDSEAEIYKAGARVWPK